MTTLKSLIGTAVLLAASTALAQPITTPFGDVLDQDGPGVIGRRYVEASGHVQQFNNQPAWLYSGGVGFNLPVSKCIDVSGSYSYGWMDHRGVDYTGNTFQATATWYSTIENGIKPFIAGTLGYSLSEAKSGDWKSDSDTGLWSITAGAEFPYKWVSLISSVSYHDDFRNSYESVQELVAGVEINSWVTPRVAVYVHLNYVNAFHDYENSWFYGAGVRVKL